MFFHDQEESLRRRFLEADVSCFFSSGRGACHLVVLLDRKVRVERKYSARQLGVVHRLVITESHEDR